MRTKLQYLFIMLAWLAGLQQAAGQLPVTDSFSQNGLLICSNLPPGTVASVQWASCLSGPWQTTWAGLGAVTADSNGLIQVSVPMFYRVAGAPCLASDGMALIPGGSFIMGDTLDGDGNAIPTNITVSAFYMDTNLVTYAQWQAVYNWATNNGYSFDNVGAGKASNHPVQTVNWYDAVKWCNARSQQASLTPVYYTDAGLTKIYASGNADSVYPNWTTNGYRLPTEAEWEKAARGGLSGQRFPWGDTISENQANYEGNTAVNAYDLGPNGYNPIGSIGGTSPATSPVGSFAPNGYGLYDMAGNVEELCWDWYGTPYGQPTTNNPTGPASFTTRIWRGGWWGNWAFDVRCARRDTGDPSWTRNYLGFRCVRGL